MKWRFLLGGLFAAGLLMSTPSALARGGFAGAGFAAGGGSGWHGGNAFHGGARFVGLGRFRPDRFFANNRFFPRNRFFGTGFAFYSYGYPWWWDLSFPYPYFPYYGYDGYYGNSPYYGVPYDAYDHSGNRDRSPADPETRTAIRAFQAQQNLPVTGHTEFRKELVQAAWGD